MLSGMTADTSNGCIEMMLIANKQSNENGIKPRQAKKNKRGKTEKEQ